MLRFHHIVLIVLESRVACHGYLRRRRITEKGEITICVDGEEKAETDLPFYLTSKLNVAKQWTVQSFDFILSFVQTSKAISGFPTGN
ncbi:hypothetical protein Peur_035791 [Populus x canadensis]